MRDLSNGVDLIQPPVYAGHRSIQESSANFMHVKTRQRWHTHTSTQYLIFFPHKNYRTCQSASSFFFLYFLRSRNLSCIHSFVSLSVTFFHSISNLPSSSSSLRRRPDHTNKDPGFARSSWPLLLGVVPLLFCFTFSKIDYYYYYSSWQYFRVRCPTYPW